MTGQTATAEPEYSVKVSERRASSIDPPRSPELPPRPRPLHVGLDRKLVLLIAVVALTVLMLLVLADASLAAIVHGFRTGK
jgi:hypothetical protein